MSFVVRGEITVDPKGVVQGVTVSKAQLEGLSRSGQRAGNSIASIGPKANATGRTTDYAAGSVANLAAQFNDIGVMMSSGQSPFILAMQQGTQVNQVLDRMGNTGKSRLGALRTALVSVVSPANLMTIGIIAGGAAILQLGMNALSAGEDTEALQERIDSVTESMSQMNIEARALRLGVSEEELALLDQVASRTRELQEAQEAALNPRTRTGATEAFNLGQAEQALSAAREQLANYRSMVAEAEALSDAVRRTADQERMLGDQMSSTQRQMLESERITRLMQGGMKAVTVQAIQAAGVDLASPVLDAASQTALLKAGLNDSVIQALELAGMDVTSPISGAANEAARLAENLGISVQLAASIARIGGSSGASGPDQAIQQVRGAYNENDLRAQGLWVDVNLPSIAATGASGSGGGSRSAARNAAAREADREREAVEDLLTTLQQELELARETDPVLQEMIGYRDDLAAATDEERAAVEDLIRTRIEEEATLERQRAGWDFWGNAALTALNDVDGALEMVLKSLQQAAFLGTGPLGALFGGTDDNGAGGLLGMVFSGLTGRAEGGPIYGTGGPRDDKQLIKTSPGEYIINAKATARHRALLDQINYGTPAFANGGIVGGGGISGASAVGSQSNMEVHVHVHGAAGDKDIEARARAGTAAALAEFSDGVLPIRMREISNNPEWVG